MTAQEIETLLTELHDQRKHNVSPEQLTLSLIELVIRELDEIRQALQKIAKAQEK